MKGTRSGEARDGGMFIPALRFHVLTPFFDLLSPLAGLGRGFRVRIIGSLAPLVSKGSSSNSIGKTGFSVLDAGCGTGSLAVDLLDSFPHIALTGVDADPAVLAIASRKAAAKGVSLRVVQGFLENLQFPAQRFDVAYSVLVFHHLPLRLKVAAAREIHRVLKKDGVFVLVDMGRPYALWGYPLSVFAALFEEGGDNLAGRIPLILADAGFSRVERMDSMRGNMEVWMARKR